MSPRSKREYVEAVHRRYKNASRSERTIILNELCATCGYNRKYAIRLLRGFRRFTKPKPRKRGKPAVYQKDDILAPLRRIWLEANLPCSKRLQAILPIWLPGYGRYFGQLSEEVTNALLSISPATIGVGYNSLLTSYQGRGRALITHHFFRNLPIF